MWCSWRVIYPVCGPEEWTAADVQTDGRARWNILRRWRLSVQSVAADFLWCLLLTPSDKRLVQSRHRGCTPAACLCTGLCHCQCCSRARYLLIFHSHIPSPPSPPRPHLLHHLLMWTHSVISHPFIIPSRNQDRQGRWLRVVDSVGTFNATRGTRQPPRSCFTVWGTNSWVIKMSVLLSSPGHDVILQILTWKRTLWTIWFLHTAPFRCSYPEIKQQNTAPTCVWVAAVNLVLMTQGDESPSWGRRQDVGLIEPEASSSPPPAFWLPLMWGQLGLHFVSFPIAGAASLQSLQVPDGYKNSNPSSSSSSSSSSSDSDLDKKKSIWSFSQWILVITTNHLPNGSSKMQFELVGPDEMR